jgi:hypothetical protein
MIHLPIGPFCGANGPHFDRSAGQHSGGSCDGEGGSLSIGLMRVFDCNRDGNMGSH